MLLTEIEEILKRLNIVKYLIEDVEGGDVDEAGALEVLGATTLS